MKSRAGLPRRKGVEGSALRYLKTEYLGWGGWQPAGRLAIGRFRPGLSWAGRTAETGSAGTICKRTGRRVRCARL